MNKSLLFTGATGFLGCNVMPRLINQFEVTTCGITLNDMIQVNLAKDVPSLDRRFDIVLHACGKAHMIPRTEIEKQMFFDVNYQGTVNLCSALEKVGVPNSFVFISTVAVYGCESGDLITEEHLREGNTPYAMSKIMAEDYLTDWCKKNGVILAILRPSLLAGRNAPGNLGFMAKGIRKGYYMHIAGGKVKKSILMAEDIANLLPLVIRKGGVYNVCDTCQPTFGEIAKSVATQLGKGTIVNIPYWIALCLAKMGDVWGSKAPINSLKLRKITESLTFSNEKARNELGWKPMDVLTNYKI